MIFLQFLKIFKCILRSTACGFLERYNIVFYLFFTKIYNDKRLNLTHLQVLSFFGKNKITPEG